MLNASYYWYKLYTKENKRWSKGNYNLSITRSSPAYRSCSLISRDPFHLSAVLYVCLCSVILRPIGCLCRAFLDPVPVIPNRLVWTHSLLLCRTNLVFLVHFFIGDSFLTLSVSGLSALLLDLCIISCVLDTPDLRSVLYIMDSLTHPLAQVFP